MKFSNTLNFVLLLAACFIWSHIEPQTQINQQDTCLVNSPCLLFGLSSTDSKPNLQRLATIKQLRVPVMSGLVWKPWGLSWSRFCGRVESRIHDFKRLDGAMACLVWWGERGSQPNCWQKESGAFEKQQTSCENKERKLDVSILVSWLCLVFYSFVNKYHWILDTDISWLRVVSLRTFKKCNSVHATHSISHIIRVRNNVQCVAHFSIWRVGATSFHILLYNVKKNDGTTSCIGPFTASWSHCTLKNEINTTSRKPPAMQQLLSSNFPLLTCEGALQESPPLISPIRAAAVGLLELIRTGPLISMEWRWGGGASMGLWDMVREVKECRFLLFFFSPARWAPLLWGPEEAPSPDSPLESDGLSNSISCRAAELNCERGREAGGNEERVVRWK